MSHEHHHEHHDCHHCCGDNHPHDHQHHHEHHDLKAQLGLIVASALLLLAAAVIDRNSSLSTWQQLLLYLVPYLLAGHETLTEAWEGLSHGDAFNEHFLMSIATIGALAIGFLPGAEAEFTEAVFVMLFFQVGELFEGYAEGQSRKSIAHLMDLRPDVAHLITASDAAQTQDLPPEEIPMESAILVRPGEKIPLDGIVISGSSQLNTMALTGESLPREVGEGDEVASGCVNLSGVLHIRTTKAYGESTVARIIALVEHATEKKSQSETFIARFARIYTPVVVFAALFIAVVPPLLSIILPTDLSPLPTDLSPLPSTPSPLISHFSTWLYRALLFLVVSCPCALVISVPLTFFGGIGGASRRGILIKGASYMDVLARTSTVVFDKTGTLTEGRFAVSAVHPQLIDEHELLHLAAHVEHFSTHPIGNALRDAFPEEATDGCRLTEVQEIAGQGIIARVEGRLVAVGNTKLMAAIGAQWHDCHHAGTIIHVAVDGQYAGHIVINDQLKADSAEAIRRLKALGVSRTVMLTGDREEVAAEVARSLGVDEYHAGLLPQDKVSQVERLRPSAADAQKRANSAPALAFVGDGINDAPVLARADVGIAMGALGSDAAIEAADVVLMDDKPSKIADSIALSRRTIAIARQNVVLAIGIKIAVLLLAVCGLATMWMAVFADVGVTVLAVLNAMRALRVASH